MLEVFLHCTASVQELLQVMEVVVAPRISLPSLDLQLRFEARFQAEEALEGEEQEEQLAMQIPMQQCSQRKEPGTSH